MEVFQQPASVVIAHATPEPTPMLGSLQQLHLIAIRPDSKLIAASTRSRPCGALWSADSGALVSSLPPTSWSTSFGAYSTTLDWSSDGSTLLVCVAGYGVATFDVTASGSA